MVIHDQSVYRTTNGSGLVKDLTLEQIRALDAGSKFDPKFAGERIPTLEEAIDAVYGKSMLNIEVKNVGSEGARKLMAEKIAALVERRNYASHVQVMAFDSDFMREMRLRSPQVSMALLAVNNTFGSKARQAANLKLDGLNLLHNTISADEVSSIHKAGLKTNVYTVNRSNSMLKALRKGVDGLITDYPEVAAAAMHVYFNGGVLPDALLDGPDGEDS
ncbi:Glycerophosphoryl diester phosphodiesterase [compost metagenome]